MIKQRDISVDILKCIAAIMIINSHMDKMYGPYSMCATGGAIGDVLFFFCSGYTLFLGRNAGFLNWYKRRINRIYPTIFTVAIVRILLNYGDWQNRNFIDVLLHGGGWFVTCIMIYYAVFWFIRRYFLDHLNWVFAFGLVSVLLWYFIMGIDANNNNMYGLCYFKWVHYFLFMLIGAKNGLERFSESTTAKTPSTPFTIIKLVVCIVIFYALCWFKCKNGLYDLLQISSLLPLMGVTCYFYRLCNTKFLEGIYYNAISGSIIRFIGGLCLEMYLIQGCLITDKMNFMFPINLFVMFFAIVVAAYLLRCFARIWSQTFKDGDYCWKEIVKL